MGERNEENPSRVFLSTEEIVHLNKDQLLHNWLKQETYINWMESQLMLASHTSSLVQDHEEKSKPPLSLETVKRENFLLMKLSLKEQETQDLLVQIQELKASQIASTASLHSSLMDPAVNVLIQNLRQELEKAKLTLEETQNELSAWKFTPDSNTGKRLMAKCRLLYQENEELGRMISSGRLAKLEGELALQRNFSEEMKKSQSELDEFLLELDEDVEGMQSTIYFLQQQLRQSREQLATVQKENDILRNSKRYSEDNVISFESTHLNSYVKETISGLEPRVNRILNGGAHNSITTPSSLEADNVSSTRLLKEHNLNHRSDDDELIGKSAILNGGTETSNLGDEGNYFSEDDTCNDDRKGVSYRSEAVSRILPAVDSNQCDKLSETRRTDNCGDPVDNDNLATLERKVTYQQCDPPSRLGVPPNDQLDEISKNQQSHSLSGTITSICQRNSFEAQDGELVIKSGTDADISNAAHPVIQLSTSDMPSRVECDEVTVCKDKEAPTANTSPLIISSPHVLGKGLQASGNGSNTKCRKRSANQSEEAVSSRSNAHTLSSGSEESSDTGPASLVSKRFHVDLTKNSLTGHENDGNPL